MAKSEAAVFTNMCMVYDDFGNVLVIDRQKKDWPGITFPGGKVERGESFVDSVTREVEEETSLKVEKLELCGIKQFQDEKDARYVVLLYKTNHFSGNLRSSDEGDVYWIKRNELLNYSLANDFKEMVEVMENDDFSEFFYFKDEENEWDFKLL